MVGRRGETPLVPPYSFRSPNKAMALEEDQGTLQLAFDTSRFARPERDTP